MQSVHHWFVQASLVEERWRFLLENALVHDEWNIFLIDRDDVDVILEVISRQS
jgi:hypothetical protein